MMYGSVLTELVGYLKDMYTCSEHSPVFKVTFLTKVIAQRMTKMRVSTIEKYINRTRLKDHLDSFVSGLRADESGHEMKEMLKHCKEYIEFHLNRTEHSIHDIISSNNVKIFNAPVKARLKTKEENEETKKIKEERLASYAAKKSKKPEITGEAQGFHGAQFEICCPKLPLQPHATPLNL
uniref:Uncharacterized protein n=1 Tax=Timema shepardi TaxID=629360 RepID=A0A7R9G3T8_TIMSH|nr:unnamed protein product [Timema shepardi]